MENNLIIKEAIKKIGMFFVQKKLTDKNNAMEKIIDIYKNLGFNQNVPHNDVFLIQSKLDHAHNINILLNFLKQNNFNQMEADNKVNFLLSKFLEKNDSVMFQEKLDLNSLYELSKASYYIKYDRNNTNTEFQNKTKYGKMLITINKAKPEKLLWNFNAPLDQNDPKCDICYENVGWKGTKFKDSRENLRTKSIILNGEKWFAQYSPYEYFYKHLIVISKTHRKMMIDDKTISRFYDFIKKNPDFFIGSNAGLPNIGGSMLHHEHYQAGVAELPIMNAKYIEIIQKNEIKIEVLNWPISTVKLISKNKNKIISIFNYLFQEWKNFMGNGIVNKNNNSFSIIAKKEGDDYCLWASYRNNSVSRNFPNGIYNIKQKRSNIKNEAIGLIEVAGQAILPGRLQIELKNMLSLYNQGKLDKIKNDNSLSKHYNWIIEYANGKKIISDNDLKSYLGDTFVKCLEDCNPMKVELFLRYIKKVTTNYFSG